MNKNSDTVRKFFLKGGWGGQCPQLKFFTNFWNCPKRVELGSSYSGCTLIQTSPTAADMTLPGSCYTGGPAKICTPHISVLYCTILYANTSNNPGQVHLAIPLTVGVNDSW